MVGGVPPCVIFQFFPFFAIGIDIGIGVGIAIAIDLPLRTSLGPHAPSPLFVWVSSTSPSVVLPLPSAMFSGIACDVRTSLVLHVEMALQTFFEAINPAEILNG